MTRLMLYHAPAVVFKYSGYPKGRQKLNSFG